MRRHRRRHATLLVALLAVAGCAGPSDTPGSAPAPPGTDKRPTVTVVRTGGFAGVRDTTTVRPDGEWTRTDRAGAERTGQLTAEQERRLGELVTDPGLAGEARQPRPSGDNGCHDTFTYQVKVDDLQVDYTECPGGGPQTAMSIASLVESATAG